MIQRIQTLFLILAIACTAIFYFLPFGEIIVNPTTTVQMKITGVEYLKNNQATTYSLAPLLVMISIINLVSVVSVFLYKRRMLQIRLNVFNLVMQLGSIGIMFFYLHSASVEFGTDYKTSILIVLPAVAAILTFLAVRAIAADEALVRSISRLRK